MNLLLDIGNTRIKWAVHDGTSMSDAFVISGGLAHQSNVVAALDQICANLDLSTIAAIWVVNVAGTSVRKDVELFACQRCSLSARFVDSETSFVGLANAYKDASQLGADRWLAMIGAVSRSIDPVCIVDAGTAVTIDFVAQGKHLGGLILPGLSLMQSVLFSSTGDIQRFSRPLDEACSFNELGTDTDTAVRHGAVQAVVGAIQFAIRQQSAGAGAFELLLTGGDAPILIPLLGCGAADYRPMLVLEGLAEVAGAS